MGRGVTNGAESSRPVDGGAMNETAVMAVNAGVAERASQPRWMPLIERLRAVRHLRQNIAQNAEALADIAGAVSGRSRAEKLASEVLPLADACRWLERNARRVLAPR